MMTAYLILVSVFLGELNIPLRNCFIDQYKVEEQYRPMDSTRTRENNIISAYEYCNGKWGDEI